MARRRYSAVFDPRQYAKAPTRTLTAELVTDKSRQSLNIKQIMNNMDKTHMQVIPAGRIATKPADPKRKAIRYVRTPGAGPPNKDPRLQKKSTPPDQPLHTTRRGKVEKHKIIFLPSRAPLAKNINAQLTQNSTQPKTTELDNTTEREEEHSADTKSINDKPTEINCQTRETFEKILPLSQDTPRDKFRTAVPTAQPSSTPRPSARDPRVKQTRCHRTEDEPETEKANDSPEYIPCQPENTDRTPRKSGHISTEPNQSQSAANSPSPPSPETYDPRIDYARRDKARLARRRTTEDPLEEKLREIFRSPNHSSKVSSHKIRNKKRSLTNQNIFNRNIINSSRILTRTPPHLPQEMSKKPAPEPMEGESQAKTARVDISNKYALKSDAFKAKKNPDAVKPREKDEDFEIKDLKRKVYSASSYKQPAPKPYLEQPTISLRSLMPGDSKEADPEDRRLDMSFKAEKVEFLLVARPVTDREIKEGCILESVNESAWDIPEAEDIEDAMGKATNMMCLNNKHLIHQVNKTRFLFNVIEPGSCSTTYVIISIKVSWSSVASQTGIGAFSMRTDNMEAMETLRGNIRSLVFGSNCFESFPKDALVQKFGLSIFFPRACAHVDEDLLIEWPEPSRPLNAGSIRKRTP